MKIKYAKKKKQLARWWFMNKCACKSTPAEVNVRLTTIHIKRYLALLIPGSRLNTRNVRPQCNCPLLKNVADWANCKNLTPRKIFTRIIINMKISRSMVVPYTTGILDTSQTLEVMHVTNTHVQYKPVILAGNHSKPSVNYPTTYSLLLQMVSCFHS